MGNGTDKQLATATSAPHFSSVAATHGLNVRKITLFMAVSPPPYGLRVRKITGQNLVAVAAHHGLQYM